MAEAGEITVRVDTGVVDRVCANVQRRVAELLRYNNEQVERRRELAAALRRLHDAWEDCERPHGCYCGVRLHHPACPADRVNFKDCLCGRSELEAAAEQARILLR